MKSGDNTFYFLLSTVRFRETELFYWEFLGARLYRMHTQVIHSVYVVTN